MRFWSVLIGLVMLALMMGCGDSSPSLESRYCTKAGECNALSGLSVNECTQNVSKCTSSLTASNKSDWDKMANTCVGYSTCSLFISCANTLPACR